MAETVIHHDSELPIPAAGKLAAFIEAVAVFKGFIKPYTPAASSNAHMRFRKDRYYLLRYYAWNMLLLFIGGLATHLLFANYYQMHFWPLWVVGLVLFVLPSFSLIFLSGAYYLALICVAQPHSFSLTSLGLVPLGILAGTISAALMHNAAHGNFRGVWLNRFWGEICGLFQLTGFAGWCISHFIHHAAPDHPEKDAHAPGDMSFRAYVNAMGPLMKTSLTLKYFEFHKENAHSRVTWALVGMLLPLVRFMRVLFVLLLLGPTAFVALYVPFKMANTLIYADFNYRTHRPTGNGGYEVLNLNHNLWYKLLNFVSFGSYFHKNHHRKANVFNPRYAGNDDKPLVTYHR
ncbi:fatty acid desaturase [Sphingomonas xinjiangensis]|uniref:Fatty acid desaturase n=1 Tax=Sphingomonas xinjiangensis TaxID=643568 RepID=A0A840YT73_9SPHN|nr:fatty acid desaturase [Sphingomonas xinjiangensis]MBB5712911.1 fatty acid desaturase [Sphingomonas xinjiangensis]